MKTLVIGDIHGCFDELQGLLDRAGLAADDRIVALGDIVDRGPQTPAVLAFFCSHQAASSIQGNHERKHVRSWRNEIPPALSQRISREQIGEGDYPTACRWMDRMPRYLELPEARLVHGHFEPGVPLAQQRETVIVGTLSGAHYLERRYSRPWYELYDEELPLIVGHHDYRETGEPSVFNDRVFAIDTGCCKGRALTGLLLPSFQMISVKARAPHWDRLRAQYVHIRFESAPIESLRPEVVARLLEHADRTPALPDPARQRIADLRALQQAAQVALDALHAHILETTERVVAGLGEAYQAATPSEQGRLFAARIGSTRLARFLHLARKQQLDREQLLRSFDTPARLIALAREMGLSTAADTTDRRPAA